MSMMKLKIQTNREQLYRMKLDQIRKRMTEDQKKTNKLNERPGSYNWLVSLPLK